MDNYEKVSSLIFRFLGVFIAFFGFLGLLLFGIVMFTSPAPRTRNDAFIFWCLYFVPTLFGLSLIRISNSLGKLICRNLN
ncbi:MAG: hypothetical protein M3209_20535 [Acidobacteriota bacterium]|nr:hypothetical protein [Acidobacteriota bacterium]